MTLPRCILLGLFFIALTVTAQQKDDPKCKDHPLFTRMPDSWLRGCDEKEFVVVRGPA